MTRKPIKKSTRFTVFARDGFTCRYCGRKSDEAKLVIDHIIPVAKSGTNDEANLCTSCEDCNSGKGVKSATPDPNNENVRLSRLQELRELREGAEAAAEIQKEKARMFQDFVNFWCKLTGRKHVDTNTANTVYSYMETWGAETVYDWVRKAAQKCSHNDQKMGCYVSGIRRSEMEAAK